MRTKFYPDYIKKEELPSWEDIILDLNLNIQRGDFIKELPKMGFVTHKGHRIESVNNIRNKIVELTSNNDIESHIYISLLSNSDNFGRHKDTMDVYFILALGNMKWVIEDEETLEFNLKPGDMIFIPKGLYHTPITNTPRVGISIG